MDELIKDNIEIVAGDDYGIKVVIRQKSDTEPILLETGDTAELVIHTFPGEIILKPELQTENSVFFYLSSDLTAQLKKTDSLVSRYKFCIRFNWAIQGRNTPVYRADLIIKGC